MASQHLDPAGDCNGNILDCAGECGGSALLDECGECNGDGSSCLSVFDNNFPDKFEINNIYPNPFNPTVNIQFSVFKAGKIVTRIVSLDGQLIKNFENAFYSPGIYNLKWSPENVPSGIYFLQIESNSSIKTEKLVYMK